jgi:hypothetical protein
MRCLFLGYIRKAILTMNSYITKTLTIHLADETFDACILLLSANLLDAILSPYILLNMDDI